MPFKKGAEWNGNRGGRKVPGLSRPVRASQGLETWARLLRMRDELVVERKQVGVDKDGNAIMVDCVLDAVLYFRVLEKILAYCWGQPLQKVDFDAEQAKGFAFAVIVNPQAEEMLNNSHREKTHKSLLKPFWQGAWRLEDGGHKAILNCGGVDGVVLSLFGIEDTAAIDRVRGEWACGWIDEASPTLEDGGVSELAFDVLATSLRVPTHARIKLVTENFPEESHWTWKRWAPTVGAWGVGYHPDDRQRMTIMIPKGDSPHITEADRREWAQALKDRPDLAARLLEGRPGSVQLGQAVAEGFNESAHVSRTRLEPYRGEPFVIGQDFGLTPATVIGQCCGPIP